MMRSNLFLVLVLAVPLAMYCNGRPVQDTLSSTQDPPPITSEAVTNVTLAAPTFPPIQVSPAKEMNTEPEQFQPSLASTFILSDLNSTEGTSSTTTLTSTTTDPAATTVYAKTWVTATAEPAVTWVLQTTEASFAFVEAVVNKVTSTVTQSITRGIFTKLAGSNIDLTLEKLKTKQGTMSFTQDPPRSTSEVLNNISLATPTFQPEVSPAPEMNTEPEPSQPSLVSNTTFEPNTNLTEERPSPTTEENTGAEPESSQPSPVSNFKLSDLNSTEESSSTTTLTWITTNLSPSLDPEAATEYAKTWVTATAEPAVTWVLQTTEASFALAAAVANRVTSVAESVIRGIFTAFASSNVEPTPDNPNSRQDMASTQDPPPQTLEIVAYNTLAAPTLPPTKYLTISTSTELNTEPESSQASVSTFKPNNLNAPEEIPSPLLSWMTTNLWPTPDPAATTEYAKTWVTATAEPAVTWVLQTTEASIAFAATVAKRARDVIGSVILGIFTGNFTMENSSEAAESMTVPSLLTVPAIPPVVLVTHKPLASSKLKLKRDHFLPEEDEPIYSSHYHSGLPFNVEDAMWDGDGDDDDDFEEPRNETQKIVTMPKVPLTKRQAKVIGKFVLLALLLLPIQTLLVRLIKVFTKNPLWAWTVHAPFSTSMLLLFYKMLCLEQDYSYDGDETYVTDLLMSDWGLVWITMWSVNILAGFFAPVSTTTYWVFNSLTGIGADLCLAISATFGYMYREAFLASAKKGWTWVTFDLTESELVVLLGIYIGVSFTFELLDREHVAYQATREPICVGQRRVEPKREDVKMCVQCKECCRLCHCGNIWTSFVGYCWGSCADETMLVDMDAEQMEENRQFYDYYRNLRMIRKRKAEEAAMWPNGPPAMPFRIAPACHPRTNRRSRPQSTDQLTNRIPEEIGQPPPVPASSSLSNAFLAENANSPSQAPASTLQQDDHESPGLMNGSGDFVSETSSHPEVQSHPAQKLDTIIIIEDGSTGVVDPNTEGLEAEKPWESDGPFYQRLPAALPAQHWQKMPI